MRLRSGLAANPADKRMTVPYAYQALLSGARFDSRSMLQLCAETVAAFRPLSAQDSPERLRLSEDTRQLADKTLTLLASRRTLEDKLALWLSPVPKDVLPDIDRAKDWRYLIEQGADPLEAAASLSISGRSLSALLAAVTALASGQSHGDEPTYAPAADRLEREEDASRASVVASDPMILLVGQREPDGAKNVFEREEAAAWSLVAAYDFTLLAADDILGRSTRHVIATPSWLKFSPRLQDASKFPAAALVEGTPDYEQARAMVNLWPLPSPAGSDLADLWDLARLL